MPDRINPPKATQFGNPGQQDSRQLSDAQLRELAAQTGRNLLTGQPGLAGYDPVVQVNTLINSYLEWIGKMLPFIFVALIALVILLMAARELVKE